MTAGALATGWHLHAGSGLLLIVMSGWVGTRGREFHAEMGGLLAVGRQALAWGRHALSLSVSIEPTLTNRNRLTTGFRFILAIPHIILVGGLGIGAAYSGGDRTTSAGSQAGLLGAVAWFLAIVSWFMIVLTGNHITGIRQFTAFYLRWRVRALSYRCCGGPIPAVRRRTVSRLDRDRRSLGP